MTEQVNQPTNAIEVAGQPVPRQEGREDDLVDELKLLIVASGRTGMSLVDLRRTMERRLIRPTRLDAALDGLRADPAVRQSNELRDQAGRPTQLRSVFRLVP